MNERENEQPVKKSRGDLKKMFVPIAGRDEKIASTCSEIKI